jgi:hypothetical protein
MQILSPKNSLLRKLVTFCPLEDAPKLRDALFEAGAGNIGNYDECSFNIEGQGTFRGNEASNPTKGKKGERHLENEVRIETIFENHKQKAILKALIKNHP